MPFLSKKERRTMDRPAKIALRKARKLKKCPDTNGVPPWVIEARERALEAAKALAAAALDAVIAAAKSKVPGLVKHNRAVAKVIDATGVSAETAIEAVWTAFDSFDIE